MTRAGSACRDDLLVVRSGLFSRKLTLLRLVNQIAEWLIARENRGTLKNKAVCGTKAVYCGQATPSCYGLRRRNF